MSPPGAVGIVVFPGTAAGADPGGSTAAAEPAFDLGTGGGAGFAEPTPAAAPIVVAPKLSLGDGNSDSAAEAAGGAVACGEGTVVFCKAGMGVDFDAKPSIGLGDGGAAGAASVTSIVMTGGTDEDPAVGSLSSSSTRGANSGDLSS